MFPEKKDDLLLRSMDTVLWTANNSHIDVLAQSVFYKLGGTTLAEHVNHEGDGNETRGKAVQRIAKKAYSI